MRADLSGAVLEGSWTTKRGLSLELAEEWASVGAEGTFAHFHSVAFREVDLTKTNGLVSIQLAGTDLSGAKLPEHLAEFKELDRVAEISKHGRNVLFSYIVLAFMSALAANVSPSSTISNWPKRSEKGSTSS